jgi:hypothetical protein
MTEIWKRCSETRRKYYEVSNFGNCKSICKITNFEHPLKPFKLTKGYLGIDIMKTIKVHKLVALHFLGERPEGLQIDHIDRNKTNNHIDNLRYVSCKENCRNKHNYRDDLPEDKKQRDNIRMKEKYAINKTIKINCGCGSTTSKAQLYKHVKCAKHQRYIQNDNL